MVPRNLSETLRLGSCSVQMNGEHDIDAGCRRDDRWRRRRLVDDCRRRCLFIDDRRWGWLIDNRWRRCWLIHDCGWGWCNNDRRRCRFIDDRRRALTLIGVMLAPLAALVLAPLMFAPPMAALVIIGAGWVRAHSAQERNSAAGGNQCADLIHGRLQQTNRSGLHPIEVSARA